MDVSGCWGLDTVTEVGSGSETEYVSLRARSCVKTPVVLDPRSTILSAAGLGRLYVHLS